MFDIVTNTFLILAGYALGCLVTGYYIVRYQSKSDVRSGGSGSAGATNVGRLLGSKGFAVTLAGDFSKGVMALIMAKLSGCHDPWLALVLLAVVAGHIWPVQLEFKGGKGVATSLGGMMIYDPLLTLLLMGVFGVVFKIFGEREVGGMITFLCLPVAALLIGRPPVVTAASLALASMLLRAHRDNLVVICGRSGARKS